MRHASVLSPALFGLAPALFASNMVIARAIGGEVPPIMLAQLRWAIAGGLLLLIFRPSRADWAALRRQLPVLAALSLLGGVLSVAPQYAAAEVTRAGNIALIFAVSPLVVCFIEAVLCRRPLGWSTLAGAALAFLGVLVVASDGQPEQLLRAFGNRGDLLAAIAALSWAAYTVLTRHRPTGLPPNLQLMAIALGSALLLAPAAAIEALGRDLPQPSWRLATAVTALAVIAGVAAYLSFGRLVARVGAARGALSMYLVPIWAMTLEAAVLQVPIDRAQLLAVALVLGGLALSHLPAGRLLPRRTVAE